MRAHFRHSRSKSFLMIQKTFQFNEFWPLQLPYKNWGVYWDSNSQSGSSFGSAGVHSLTFSCTLGSMKCDSRAHFWLALLQALALFASPKLRFWHLVLPKGSIWNHHYTFPHHAICDETRCKQDKVNNLITLSKLEQIDLK
jgi:hypothetical protein